jgi:hypothetical protein
MAGQYIDPLTVECPFCKTKAAYPLKDLENYQAVCIQCNKSLAQVSCSMDQSKHKNSIELWNFWLVVELLGDHFPNESLTEEEINQLQTLGDLVTLLTQIDPSVSLEMISQHPTLSPAIKLFADKPVSSIKLHDLAIATTPLKKMPFNP